MFLQIGWTQFLFSVLLPCHTKRMVLHPCCRLSAIMSSSLPSLCLTPLIATQSHPPSLDGLPHRQGGVDLGNRKSMRKRMWKPPWKPPWKPWWNLREHLGENLVKTFWKIRKIELGENLVEKCCLQNEEIKGEKLVSRNPPQIHRHVHRLESGFPPSIHRGVLGSSTEAFEGGFLGFSTGNPPGHPLSESKTETKVYTYLYIHTHTSIHICPPL